MCNHVITPTKHPSRNQHNKYYNHIDNKRQLSIYDITYVAIYYLKATAISTGELELRILAKNISQKQCTHWDSNPALFDCKSRVLPTSYAPMPPILLP